ncbi:MAG: hypothetical protein ABR612_11955 [Chromatocurvus sp.]
MALDTPAAMERGLFEPVADFRRASADYLSKLKADLGGFIDQGEIMRAEDLASLPQFQWSPRRMPPYTAMAILFLVTVFVGFVCARRLRLVSVQ